MGIVEALSNVSHEVRQLLDLSKDWPASPPVDPPAPPSYKTACQLKPHEIDQLVAAYQAGATTRQLATQFNIWRGTVSKHLKARGIDTRASKLTPEEIQKAIELYSQGLTLVQIAEKLGTNYTTLWRRLTEAGIQMRGKGRTRGGPSV